MRRILSYLRRAVDDYHMIEPGDRIAVGISGGKDSLTLLAGLAALKRFYPNSFELEAITVDMGFGDVDFSDIATFAKKLGVPYTVRQTDIAEIIFDIRKESNPCSLCAKLRHGALHDEAIRLGCNKVALGHHNDDVIETFFLSLFYEGRIHCFSPVTYLDRKQITLIRPMIYLPELDIIGFTKREQLPVTKSLCPADGHTRREEMKQFIKAQVKEHKGIKQRFFTAIQNSEIAGWRLEKE